MTGSPLQSNSCSIAYPKGLAGHLRVSLRDLISIADDVDGHWRPGKRLVKKDGTLRVTQSASKELKRLHQRINRSILRKTAYPDYLYGSVPKTIENGVRTHIENARLHAGYRLIMSLDIKNFFPSVDRAVIRGIWQGFYPFSPEVAELLTTLTTYRDELPQGWACSSYLAQLVFWDSEETIVERLREQGMTYSRLTDDITVSTQRQLTRGEMSVVVVAIISMLCHKGTRLNRRKTRIDSRSSRQSVNRINVSSGKPTLPASYRKTVRARVHRITSSPELFRETIEKELQSVKSQIAYLGKFHKSEAHKLKARIAEFENSQ